MFALCFILTRFMGHFDSWAILYVKWGRFGHIKNLWAILVRGVWVHGLFSYRPGLLR